MNETLKDFLLDILDTPSPSGCEANLGIKFMRFCKPFVDEVYADSMGNVVAHKKGNPSKKVMIEAHTDEVGLMVTYIDKNGYLFFKTIGGVDANILPGMQVIVHGLKGPMVGVIGRKPIHLLTAKEREVVVKLEDLWIDIGVKDKAEAEQYVRVGTPATYNTVNSLAPNNYVFAKSLDDKSGLTVVAGVAQMLASQSADTDYDLYFVGSTQEEIGTRGAQVIAQQIQPDIAISLDVTHATDYPGVAATRFGEFNMGKGVVIPFGPNLNQKLNELYISLAQKNDIPYQIEAIPRATATDARTIQLTGKGVVTSLLSIPCRYMHTPNEVVCLDDIQSAISLITEFCKTKTEPKSLFPISDF